MGECTMICLDNSEWMRNGDYSRTRFEAQHEGAHAVLGYKSQNPESTVGVVSLAGGANVGVQVLCSPTDEKIKVMRAFATAKVGGRADVVTGLRVAQLALKYKPSHFKSRIVVFVGSPIEEGNHQKLIKVAKNLRKVNISVDIISMGEHDHNKGILEEFIGTVNKGDTSTLIVVPPGTFPEDAINSAFRSDDTNQWAEYGGINPEQDPELAEVMRQSILEAQAQEQASGRGGGAAATTGGSGSGGAKQTTGTEELDEEEDELLKQAMEMSMAAVEEITGEEKEKEKSEETETEKAKEGDKKEEDGKEKSMLDPNFMKNLVKDIPGVDVDSDEIQNLLKEEDGKGKKKKKDEEKPKKKE